METVPQVGQVVTVSRVFSQEDFDQFAALSGDNNPIHVNPEFATMTRFGKTVAHGMLLYSAIWDTLERYYPNAVQREQALMFPNPTFADEEVIVRLEVTEVHPEGRVAQLETIVTKANGEIVCQGHTVVEWSATGR